MKGNPRYSGEISMRSTSVHPERRKLQTVEHVESMEGEALEWCIRQFGPGDKPELPEARASAGHCAQQATDRHGKGRLNSRQSDQYQRFLQCRGHLLF